MTRTRLRVTVPKCHFPLAGYLPEDICTQIDHRIAPHQHQGPTGTNNHNLHRTHFEPPFLAANTTDCMGACLDTAECAGVNWFPANSTCQVYVDPTQRQFTVEQADGAVAMVAVCDGKKRQNLF